MNILDIERATITAWPAAVTEYHDGWAYLASSGVTGRVNAVWPLEWSGDDPDFAVKHAARWYRARKLTPRFKLTQGATKPDDIEHALWNNGLRPDEGDTLIMTRPIERNGPMEDSVALHTSLPAAFEKVLKSSVPDVKERAERIAIAKRAAPTSVYAVLDHGRSPGAIGMVGRTGALAGIFLMRTIPDARRQGYARRILRALLARAGADGATRAYLQVEADNTSAVALYAAEGFEPLSSYVFWSAAY